MDTDQHTKAAFMKGREMFETMRSMYNSLSYLRHDAWSKDIESLEQAIPPKTTIAICGATGAGKSSLLNSILGDNIVPTSGMQACTASVAEVSYSSEPGISAIVEFISLEEWTKEVDALLSDVKVDGKRALTDANGIGGVAWQKIRAVYPDIQFPELMSKSVEQILESNPGVSCTLLRGSQKLYAQESSEFRKLCSKYMQSAAKPGSKNADGAVWPLVRKIRIACDSPALSTGAVLVDLPGLADTNAARSAVALDYLKNCQHIWIAAPITRAVNDKIAKDLLDKSHKALMMHGRFQNVEDSLTFVATKCDDIVKGEIIENLSLQDDPMYLRIKEQQELVNHQIGNVGRRADDGFISSNYLSPFQNGRYTPLPKRSSPDPMADSAVAHKRVRLESDPHRPRINRSESSPASFASYFGSSIQVPSNGSMADIVALKRQERALKLYLNSYCSQKRSQHTIELLQEDFRNGLKEFDEEEAEKNDPDNYDPTDELRNYGRIFLPVITVSSRDYMILEGQNWDDEEPSCFGDVKDTGIPALIRRCHDLTSLTHKRAAQKYISSLRQLSYQIRNKVAGSEEVEEDGKKELKRIWKAGHFSAQVQEGLLRKSQTCAKKMQEAFRIKLEPAVKRAANWCVLNAGDTTEKLTKGHHATFRAVIKRHGKYGGNNFNLQMASLMTIRTARTIRKLFAGNITAEVGAALARVISRSLKKYEDEVPSALRGQVARLREQEETCGMEMVNNALDSTRAAMLQKLKDAGRALEPLMKSGLEPAFILANEETGKGSIAKQMTILREFIHANAPKIFGSLEAKLLQCVEETCALLETHLSGQLKTVTTKIELGMSVLWDERGGQSEQDLRKSALKQMNDLCNRIDTLHKQTTSALDLDAGSTIQ